MGKGEKCLLPLERRKQQGCEGPPGLGGAALAWAALLPAVPPPGLVTAGLRGGGSPGLRGGGGRCRGFGFGRSMCNGSFCSLGAGGGATLFFKKGR
jgi:hypothetical protein